MTSFALFALGFVAGQFSLLGGMYLAMALQDARDARWTLPDPETTLTPPPLSLRRSQGKPVRLRWPS